jgi:hypothetical protein
LIGVDGFAHAIRNDDPVDLTGLVFDCDGLLSMNSGSVDVVLRMRWRESP